MRYLSLALLLSACDAPSELSWPAVADETQLRAESEAGRLTFWPYGVKGGGHPEGHAGWDIDAPEGSELIAVGSGHIKRVGECGGSGTPCSFGHFIILKLTGGGTVSYQHTGMPLVNKGDDVAQDDVIANFEPFGDEEPLVHFDIAPGLNKLCPEPYMSAAALEQAELWRSLSNGNPEYEDPAYLDADNRYSALCFEL